MKIIYILKTIAALGQLNGIMELNEWQRSGSFFVLGQRSLRFQIKTRFAQKLWGHLQTKFI